MGNSLADLMAQQETTLKWLYIGFWVTENSAAAHNRLVLHDHQALTTVCFAVSTATGPGSWPETLTYFLLGLLPTNVKHMALDLGPVGPIRLTSHKLYCRINMEKAEEAMSYLPNLQKLTLFTVPRNTSSPTQRGHATT